MANNIKARAALAVEVGATPGNITRQVETFDKVIIGGAPPHKLRVRWTGNLLGVQENIGYSLETPDTVYYIKTRTH